MHPLKAERAINYEKRKQNKSLKTKMITTQLDVVPPSAVESISRAEVDIQISTAHRYPRQLAKVKSDMLSFATLDEETAQSCFYTLPRGGKNIQGPSIRMAEIAVSCYGNLRAGTRIIETVTSGDAPHVLLQAVCHDLEKNTAITIEKRRRIVGKKSKGGQIDEDDINLAANAGSAIAFRDAVFKIVPGALIRPVYEQAKRVAIGDAKTLGDRRAKAVEAFAKMGVNQARVLASLEKGSIEEVTISDLETLIGLHTAIKDGQTSIDDAFPTERKKTPSFAEPTAPTVKGSSQVEPPDDIPMGDPVNVAETPQQQLSIAVSGFGCPERTFIDTFRKLSKKIVGAAATIKELSDEAANAALAEIDILLSATEDSK